VSMLLTGPLSLSPVIFVTACANSEC
jgi:hypothetical protein